MKARLLVALLVALAPVAARAADEENPYKKVKVGDFATYKMTTKIGGQSIEATATQTVTAKDEKEATVKMTIKANGMEVPGQEVKIDLTKPYDPTKTGLPPGADVKVEKQKDGKEKLKAAGKEYDCKWESYTVTGKAMGLDIKAEVKVWQSKDLPLQVVKMESTAEVAGMKVETVMELAETGSKSD
jgi:hypothetical protein